MSSLKGSIIITGANGGLGRAFASQFLKSPHSKNYRGIYTVRNPSTALELNALIRKAPESHTSEVLALKLDTLESIREFAEEINQRVAAGTLEPIRALILNAAWQECNANTLKPQTFTPDGYEAAFAINYLANFLLTLLLLKSMDKEHGRIVMVGSSTHDPYYPHSTVAKVFNREEYRTVFKDTETLSRGVEYFDDGENAGIRRYGASKTLLVMFAYELQRRLNLDPNLSNISVLTMDPGGMGGTGITRNGSLAMKIMTRWVLPFIQTIWVIYSPNGMIRPPSKSGADLLAACFDEKSLGEHPKGVYLNGSERFESSLESRDEKKQRKLWVESLKMTRVGEQEIVLKAWV